MKALNFLAAVLFGITFSFSNTASANPYPAGSQQWHNYNAQMQDAARQNRGYSANAHRAAIKADMERMRIEKLRKTPYYGVIAYNYSEDILGGTLGYKSEKKAVQKATEMATENRNQDKIEIIATFSNACVVLAKDSKPLKSKADFFVGIDPSRKKAEQKAVSACEAVNGEGNCFPMKLSSKGDEVLCSGYEYGIYNSK